MVLVVKNLWKIVLAFGAYRVDTYSVFALMLNCYMWVFFNNTVAWKILWK